MARPSEAIIDASTAIKWISEEEGEEIAMHASERSNPYQSK
ncbi:MAG: hypothetical protein ACLFVP_09250 [Candidatus Bathyarchaeia archaeon]